MLEFLARGQMRRAGALARL